MSTVINTCPWDQQLARLIIRPFKDTKLHPNHLTTITLVLGQSAAWMFAFAIEQFAWLAALLYMLAIFTDHMDGEFARLTGKTSKFGHNYDYYVGGMNYTALYIGIGIGLYGTTQAVWAILLGLLAGLSNPLLVYLRMTLEKYHGPQAVQHPAFAGFEIEDFVYLIGPFTWFAGIIYFFIPFALGCMGYLIWTISVWHYWQKQTDEI